MHSLSRMTVETRSDELHSGALLSHKIRHLIYSLDQPQSGANGSRTGIYDADR